MKLLDEKRGAVHRVVTFRLHDHLYRALEKKAARARMTVSDFIRQAIDKAIR